MLEMILSLISEFTQSFLNPETFKYKRNNKILKSLIKIVITQTELLEYLKDFRSIWDEWIKSNYDSTPCYYFIIPDMKIKLINLMQFYKEVSHFIEYENSDLDYTMINFIWGKSNIFNVWESILKMSNDSLYYEHNDKTNKVMYIPNYSFILTDLKPIAKCSKKDIDFFVNMFKNKYGNDFDIDYACYFYERYMNTEVKMHGFNYFPILLKENYEFKNNPYVLKLRIPEDIDYIKKFIVLTDESIDQLRDNIELCKKIIEKYSQQENKDLLNLILNSCDKIK